MTTCTLGSFLCPLDWEHQVSIGKISRTNENGDRNYHDEEWSRRCFVDAAIERRVIVWPDQFVSERTLVLVGFTSEKAHALWKAWKWSTAAATPWDPAVSATWAFYARAMQMAFIQHALRSIHARDAAAQAAAAGSM